MSEEDVFQWTIQIGTLIPFDFRGPYYFEDREDALQLAKEIGVADRLLGYSYNKSIIWNEDIDFVPSTSTVKNIDKMFKRYHE